MPMGSVTMPKAVVLGVCFSVSLLLSDGALAGKRTSLLATGVANTDAAFCDGLTSDYLRAQYRCDPVSTTPDPDENSSTPTSPTTPTNPANPTTPTTPDPDPTPSDSTPTNPAPTTPTTPTTPESPGTPSPNPTTPASYSVNLSWTIPSARENGQALLMSELAKYEIYYVPDGAGAGTTIAVNGGSTVSYKVTGLAAGTYYFAISAIDTGGLKSALSSPVSIVLGP